jgi:hypothetical protein
MNTMTYVTHARSCTLYMVEKSPGSQMAYAVFLESSRGPIPVSAWMTDRREAIQRLRFEAKRRDLSPVMWQPTGKRAIAPSPTLTELVYDFHDHDPDVIGDDGPWDEPDDGP